MIRILGYAAAFAIVVVDLVLLAIWPQVCLTVIGALK